MHGRKKVDIIIPNYKNIQLLESCLSSIEEHTLEPYRVVLFDNGSGEKTVQRIKGLLSVFSDALLLESDRNLGFIKAVNRSIVFSDASYICLLNNDTRVTEKWLDVMISELEKDKKLGLVCPLTDSSCVSTNHITSEIRKSKDRVYRDVRMIPFFCVVIKREAFEDIGFLDESFGIGLGDDDDYCERARHGGWSFGVALDSFVYHTHAHATFKVLNEETGFDYYANAQEALRRYKKKWSVS